MNSRPPFLPIILVIASTIMMFFGIAMWGQTSNLPRTYYDIPWCEYTPAANGVFIPSRHNSEFCVVDPHWNHYTQPTPTYYATPLPTTIKENR